MTYRYRTVPGTGTWYLVPVLYVTDFLNNGQSRTDDVCTVKVQDYTYLVHTVLRTAPPAATHQRYVLYQVL